MKKRPYRIQPEDKEIEFLLVTPFSNGSADMVKFFPKRGKILVAHNRNVQRLINDLLNRGMIINNIIFTHLEIDNKYISELKSKNIRVSFYGHGWFPYFTKHFDPYGFSHKSLLSNSDLSSLSIDMDKTKEEIENFKNKYMVSKKTKDIKIETPYIVVVLQKTIDVTIRDGYKDFESWQKIIDFAYSQLNKDEILVIKAHKSQFGKNEKIVAPLNSIIIQSKMFNNSILQNSNMIIGVNSTMLYEASILYNKPVLALGDSWFSSHPEVVKKCDINDTNIARPIITEDTIDYRTKMFYIMSKIQTTPFIYNFSHNFIDMHYKASMVEKIEDWLDIEETNYLKGTPEEKCDYVLENKRKYEKSKYEQLLSNPKIEKFYGKKDHSQKIANEILALNIKSVCDVGCGVGTFCRWIKKSGCSNVIGLDFAFKNEGDDIQWISSYAHDIPIKDNSVEYATSFDCLEHVLPEDIDLVLSEMKRISTKGFIISVPYHQSPTKHWKQGLHPIVKNKEWWVNKLSFLGEVEELKENYFYIKKKQNVPIL